jgi:hypothetical protein
MCDLQRGWGLQSEIAHQQELARAEEARVIALLTAQRQEAARVEMAKVVSAPHPEVQV